MAGTRQLLFCPQCQSRGGYSLWEGPGYEAREDTVGRCVSRLDLVVEVLQELQGGLGRLPGNRDVVIATLRGCKLVVCV